VIRLGTYDGAMREMILAIKFQRWWEMGRTLGRMLGDRVAADVELERRNTVVVPVPMPWQRRLFRGIDHARVIASGVAEAIDVPMWTVLSKVNGAPQLALGTSERTREGGRGLRIRSRLGGWELEGRDVVLVDDVRTTGATLRRAARLLNELKPRRVIVAVVAVADDRTRRARSAQVRAAFSTNTNE
jgi:ComF family protein